MQLAAIQTSSHDHRPYRWLALPLEGAITGLTPKRGTELHDRITRTAIRKRVKAHSFYFR